MSLKHIFNRIVSIIFGYFEPKVIYAKVTDGAIDPTCRKDGSLGWDLYTPRKVVLEPGERKIVDTGIAFEFPSYLGMFVWGKSSMAAKNFSVHGGVIDPGYRGTVGIVLQNDNFEKVEIPEKSAIAQVVFHLAVRPTFTDVDESELSETVRGERGFGEDWELHHDPKRNSRPNDP